MRHLLGVSVALTAACAGGEISTPTNTTADSAGIAVVTSYRSVWGERSAHVDSNPVLRIGVEQPGPYQFSFVSMAILLEGGGIAAVEAMTNEVRLFDAQGQHIRSVGRRGRGPGEFQTITGLFRTSGDSLSTYDQVERRATVFPVAAGEPRVVRSEAVPGGRLPLFDRAFVDGDDRLWVGSAVWPEQRSAPSEWSVFAPNGVWLGDVVAPPQLRILDVRDGLVLGVWQEDGEAPYVQVHRLRRP